jgi:hypothetical protein
MRFLQEGGCFQRLSLSVLNTFCAVTFSQGKEQSELRLNKIFIILAHAGSQIGDKINFYRLSSS